MDLIRFREGILSIAGMDFVISALVLTLPFLAKDILVLEPVSIPPIVYLCLINVCFSLYYLYIGYTFYDIVKLNRARRKKYGWRLVIPGLLYIGNIVYNFLVILYPFVDLMTMFLFLLLISEIGVVGVSVREGYDLIHEDERFFEKYEQMKRM